MLEVVYRGGRPGRIERTGTVFTDVRIQVVNGEAGRLPVAGDIGGGKGHGHLVLGIFAVDHDLVAGHPRGLGTGGREDEGKRKGYGIHFHLFFFLLLRIRDRVLLAGIGQREEGR